MSVPSVFLIGATTLLMAFCVLIPSAPARAEELTMEQARSRFISGRGYMRQGLHAKAEAAYLASLDTLDLVGDYVRLAAAEAEAAQGKYAEALALIRDAVTFYPGTPVVPHADRLRVSVMLDAKMEGALDELARYVRQYPSDIKMRLRYGMALKAAGRTEEADVEFLELYRMDCEYSDEALAALSSSECVTHDDRFSRARNLMSHHAYDRAEPLLRSLLTLEEYRADEAVRTHLAKTLFRQKKYPEAARLYEDLDDLYQTARAQIRSGQSAAFEQTVVRMKARKDPEAPKLLVAVSEEMRREGDSMNALLLLGEVRELFPYAAEDVLWASGWILYLDGAYSDAAETFRELSGKWEVNRYRYWFARSLERAGRSAEATKAYRAVEGSDYYAYLAALRIGRPLSPSSTAVAAVAELDTRRVDLLTSLGLMDEAAEELEAMASGSKGQERLVAVAYKLQEINRFHDAIRLMLRVPEAKRPDEILYPLAYWQTVSEVSDALQLDPLLLLSVIREESRFQSDALSPAGAIGLMQLMPQTAKRAALHERIEINGRESISVVENNIRLGSRYLSQLVEEFGSVPASLAAYNAGEQRVRQWREAGNFASDDEFVEDIPYQETRDYVKRILGSYYKYLQMRLAVAGSKHLDVL
jgi:soluble lytic murein transglycosylase